MGKEKQEREKLLHKYKREMKGAIREIRRDKSFLAKLKLKQTLQKWVEQVEQEGQLLFLGPYLNTEWWWHTDWT